MAEGLTRGRFRSLLVLAPLVLAVGAYGTFAVNAPLSLENGVHLYAGQRFTEGIAPYVSAFDGSGPFTPWVAGVSLRVADRIGRGFRGVNELFVLLNCLLVVAIYHLLRQTFSLERPAFLGTLAFVALWALPPQLGSQRWSESLVLLNETCCLTLAGRQRWLAAGVFGGLAALAQPRAGLVALAVLIVAGTQPRPSRVKAVARTLAGTLLPLAPAGLYFLLTGAAGEAFRSIVVFHLFHAERPALWTVDTLSSIAAAHGRMLFPLWLGLLLVPGLGAERRKAYPSWGRFVAGDPTAPAVLGWLLLLIWTALPFGREPSLAPLLPMVVLGFTWILERAVAASQQTVPGGSRASALLAGLALAAVALTALAGNWGRRSSALRWQQSTAHTIERRLGQHDVVLSMGAPDILALMRRPSPSRYTHLEDGVQGFIDATHGGFSRWVESLERLDPAAILWKDTSGPHVATLCRWLASRYDAEVVGPVTVYSRRPARTAAVELAPPNIVLITIDTLRADHLGCYGYHRDTSHGIDELAAGSIVFERCVAPMATTLPSHTSLLTGTYPLEHGVLANAGSGGEKFVAHPRLRSAAQVARDRGYRTAAFVSAAPLKQNNGIAAGFDTFVEPQAAEARLAQSTILDSIAWVNRNTDAPFFLWVHLWDPHSPYAAPRPYDTLYRTDATSKASLTERGVGGSVFRKGRAARLTNAYDGEIRYVDDWVGVLLERLDQGDLRERTAVMLAGDHGEALGQHGEWEHGCVHQSQIHVPLIMRVPGQPPRRIAHTVSLVDAFPTLLGLLHQAWPELAEQSSGVDVLADGFEPRPVFSQRETNELRAWRHALSYVQIDEEWKLVHEPEARDHLYHVPTDPHDLADRAAQEPAIVAALKQKLLAELARQRQRGDALRERAPPTDTDLVDPDQLEALRALGYVH